MSPIKTLTIGQVAELFGVATRTASKWFDTGRMHGYRLPHPKGHGIRRVLESSVIALAKECGLPLPEEMCREEEQCQAEQKLSQPPKQ